MFPPPLPVYDSAQRRPPLVGEFTDLLRHRELIVQLVGRNIKTRYKRSVLGVAWTMLNPLMMTIILALVFSELFRFPMRHYPVYLLCGTVFWNFFAQTTLSAMSELVWGGGLLNRIYVPRAIFAATALGTALVNLFLSLPPLFLVIWFMGAPLKPALLFLPVAILLAALFSFGVGLILSTLSIQFADVVEMYQILLPAMYFLTPIIYPLDYISEPRRWLFKLNPVYYLLEVFRQPIYEGRLPSMRVFDLALIVSVGTAALGWWLFTRKANQFAYRV
jgi:ABC-type polysaccharide/polyol phosphate export permease